jgi:hypothetical protein
MLIFIIKFHLKLFIFLVKKQWKSIWILKFISVVGEGAVGAAKLGEGLSKLQNLTKFNLTFM